MIKIENLTKSYRTPTGRHYVFKNLNIIFPKGYN
ncbi:ABC transporter ATP-binding protein, partial [Escherichia coli]|nr:ABC transporter ATP-binding protein [Escherichia coli]